LGLRADDQAIDDIIDAEHAPRVGLRRRALRRLAHGSVQRDHGPLNRHLDALALHRRIRLDHLTHRIGDRGVAVGLGRLNAKPVDDVAATRHKPSEHAGEPLPAEPRDLAVERDHAVRHGHLDPAGGIGGPAQGFDHALRAGADHAVGQHAVAEQRPQHGFTDGPFAHRLGRPNPQPVDDACHAVHPRRRLEGVLLRRDIDDLAREQHGVVLDRDMDRPGRRAHPRIAA
jgi:hypothetical protein